jgi:hypothetical protein
MLMILVLIAGAFGAGGGETGGEAKQGTYSDLKPCWSEQRRWPDVTVTGIGDDVLRGEEEQVRCSWRCRVELEGAPEAAYTASTHHTLVRGASAYQSNALPQQVGGGIGGHGLLRYQRRFSS